MTGFDLDAWLSRAQVQGIKLGLDNIRAVLSALGQPQRRYPSLLIGGTNGKGSTVAFASAILRAQGLSVGATVSPHLTEYRERFLLDGEPIAQDSLERLARRVAGRIDDDPSCAGVTFFELGVALALTWFADRSVDAAVVEVGMGGEFDATRASEPVTGAITSVDMDHVRHLGPTVLDIARTKARIAPRGGILVVGETREDRLGPVLEEAAAVHAAVWLRGREFSIELVGSYGSDTPTGDLLRYRGPGRALDGLTLSLAGVHQRSNAATAVAAVDAFCDAAGRPRPSDDAVRVGLATARIPGRMERLPLGSRGAHALLDGAHNPAGADALAAELRARPRPRRRVWLYAAMGDKDRQPILDALLPHVDEVWCTKGTSTPRFAEPELLAEEIAQSGDTVVRLFPHPDEALAAAESLGPDDELLVAGSLYLVGDVRPRLVPSPPPAIR